MARLNPIDNQQAAIDHIRQAIALLNGETIAPISPIDLFTLTNGEKLAKLSNLLRASINIAIMRGRQTKG